MEKSSTSKNASGEAGGTEEASLCSCGCSFCCKGEGSATRRHHYTCNICYDEPTGPIVTKCGHLYCWPCIHKWLKRSAECPVCKAEVARESVTPIYGHDEESRKDPRENPRYNADSADEVPERPHATAPPPPARRGGEGGGFNWFFGVPLLGVFYSSGGTAYYGGSRRPRGRNGQEDLDRISHILSVAFLVFGIGIALWILFFGEYESSSAFILI